ncbi:MAG: hypothetical protein WCC12_19670 [Anaerolineales bacterium]
MFATDNDISRCESLLKNILSKRGVNLDNNSIDKIVRKVLAIIYAKGGDYRDEILKDYIEMYLDDNPIQTTD